MTQPLFIFAEITPKAEHFQDARQAVVSILDVTRSEAGCRSFDLFEGPDRKVLYLFEEWDDQAALDQHHAQPYTAAVFKDYETWLSGPPRILPLHSVT